MIREKIKAREGGLGPAAVEFDGGAALGECGAREIERRKRRAEEEAVKEGAAQALANHERHEHRRVPGGGGVGRRSGPGSKGFDLWPGQRWTPCEKVVNW